MDRQTPATNNASIEREYASAATWRFFNSNVGGLFDQLVG
jgi:hypothetical protein